MKKNIRGLRRTKTTNGVTTVHMWDGDNIIADLDGNYALKTGYARANDLSTMYNADGDEWYYIMSDRGDTIQMYNDTTETNYLYDAYGNQQTETAADINPFRYSGEYYDAETGFIYLRARYYDPTIGRFVSEDPIRDGLNWYEYCGNNPIVFVDPTGLFGQNTKLSRDTSNNSVDLITLQRRLVELGYLDMSKGESWGSFGEKTEAAVNRYKDENGLWNSGEYRGVVGEATWKHLGLKIDTGYQSGTYIGSPEAYGKGLFVNANGPSVTNGLMLGTAEIGLVSIGGDYQYGYWECNAVNANAAAGITHKIIGVQLGGSLVSGEGAIKIPIPFTERMLVLGAEGNVVGAEVNFSYENGKVKIGVTAGLGGNIIIGIE